MNADEKFVHLHVHTEYSLLDGLSQINRLMDRAQELEMQSLAITDHGVMFGVIDFFRAAQKRGIRPVIGMEAYLAKRGMEDRDPKHDKKPYHMLLLAKNQTGYRNLLKLASEAQLRGYYYQPRIDRELMEQYSEGIIATSGCLGAEVPQTIMNGQDNEARELIGWYQEVFGPENFYLELQYHDIDVLENVNRWLAEYRKSNHTPVQFLATNDVHYVLESDHDPHDTLLCIQTGNLKADGNRMSLSDASYHLTSHDEMDHIIGSKYSWLPDEMRHEALLNTAKVASMCDVDLNTEGYHLPRFPVPDGYNERDYLRYLVDKGRYWRYGDDADQQVYIERMEHELGIIDSMGFNTYFLIVWDLCEFARHADIWWNVRGSGAGSMVAYCLGITNLDPIQNSLIFERFLNPGRVSMPDIDLDYPDDRRGEMIEYTAQKYGSDKVAAIITFGTMGAKAAIRDVGRALDVPLSEINRAVAMIPTEARQKSIEQYVEANPELKDLYRQNAKLRRVIDTAKVLQGVARHASTHAAGVIVADEPLVNYLPLHRLTKSSSDEGSTLTQVTQFPMETCESLGLLKVDFLGLSTLTILRRASDLIFKHHNKRWTMDNIPYRPHEGDDLTDEQVRENEMLAAAFEMMGRGETVGVFQVESVGMQQMLRGMRPKKYEHIVAGISLYRPGPMDYIPTYNARMHGKEDVHYHHEKLEPILSETYGILVYQEQIMQVAADLFGYQLGEADLMRRAVSKKKQKELVKHKGIFLEKGPENGIPAETAQKIFDDIEFFANYGFNKCLTADARIVDADTGAMCTIGELYAGQATVYKTPTLAETELRIQTAKIRDVVFNGIRPVYELVTRTGKRIRATGNHPLFTFDGWKTLDELSVNDLIATPRILPLEGKKSWPDYKAITLGHLIAEGNLCHTTGVYYYTGSDTQRDNYIHNMQKFDNSTASVARHKSAWSIYSKRAKRSEPQGLVEWIKQLGLWGKGAYDKFIPPEVFELNNHCISLIIAKMWEGDGHVNTSSAATYYATFSSQLARDLQHLLLRLGIVCRVYEQHFAYKDGRIGYQVHIIGQEMVCQFHEKIGRHFCDGHKLAALERSTRTHLSNGSVRDVVPVDIRHVVRQERVEQGLTWKKLSEHAGAAIGEFSRTKSHAHRNGFQRETISRLASALDSPTLHKYATSDIYWDQVVSIEYAGEEPVYDLEIEGTHNFIANDIIVHNSHAADYAMVTVQTGFLKCHYPAEYMAALLSVYREDSTKVSSFLEECGRLNIAILPPDVNYSEVDFDIQTLEDGTRGIRFGMAAIKNAGVGAIQIILDARAGELFNSLTDFCERVDLRQVGKRTLESLAKVGALDAFAENRNQLLQVLDQMMSFSADHHKAKEVGQISMFGAESGIQDEIQLPSEPPLPTRMRLDWEKELLGFYVTDHPVDSILRTIDAGNAMRTFQFHELDDLYKGRKVSMVALISEIREIPTRRGDMMAVLSMEDRYGSIEVVLFPRNWERNKDIVRDNLHDVVLVRGEFDIRNERPQILVNEVTQQFDTFVSDDNGMGLMPPSPTDTVPPPPDDDDEPPTIDWGGYNGGAAVTATPSPSSYSTAVAPAQPSPEIQAEDAVEVAVGPQSGIDWDTVLEDDPHLNGEDNGSDQKWAVAVYLQADDDAEKTRRRLRRIHGRFTEYTGDDRFMIIIEREGQTAYRMEFPNHRTSWCPALEKALKKIVGEDKVQVFEDS